MKCPRTYLLVALQLLTASAAAAQQHTPPHQAAQQHALPHQQGDPLAQHLFPPELIMRHQQDIGLGAEQRTAITKAIQDFQARTVEFQWRVEAETQKLGEMLSKPAADQTAVLQQLDQVLNIEREVKRAHIGLLVLIKNTLTAEQQAKLQALRQEP